MVFVSLCLWSVSSSLFHCTCVVKHFKFLLLLRQIGGLSSLWYNSLFYKMGINGIAERDTVFCWFSHRICIYSRSLLIYFLHSLLSFLLFSVSSIHLLCWFPESFPFYGDLIWLGLGWCHLLYLPQLGSASCVVELCLFHFSISLLLYFIIHLLFSLLCFIYKSRCAIWLMGVVASFILDLIPFPFVLLMYKWLSFLSFYCPDFHLSMELNWIHLVAARVCASCLARFLCGLVLTQVIGPVEM